MSFWGNKLGAPPPPPQQQQSLVDPAYLPSRQQVHQHVTTWPGQPQAPAAPPPPPADFDSALRQWRGKEGAQETAQTGQCPNCGSNNFFSRRGNGVLNSNSGQMVPPAPECFNCGYPRNSQGILAGIAVTEGPATATRQGAAPAPTGSIGNLGRA